MLKYQISLFKMTVLSICTVLLLNACSDNNSALDKNLPKIKTESTSTSKVVTSSKTLAGSTLKLSSLSELTIESLRSRPYQSQLKIQQTLHTPKSTNDYTSYYFKENQQYSTYLASYNSDGLNVYTRLDIPDTPMPANGYPVIVFIHGWVGTGNAPTYNFSYKVSHNYADIIDQYVKQGFIVLSPGLRGHGTVNGIAADGIEFMKAWDNATYLSPIFYTIDTLNLIEGISSLESINWQSVNSEQSSIVINKANINITGHSQGGDVVLSALAISGEGSTIKNSIRTGAIWAGCFLPRLEQGMLYGPMGNTSQAFLSGDGTWTKSAYGKKGEFNPNFKFAYPADWIEFPDDSKMQWTWQQDTWPIATVKQSLSQKYKIMYDTLNAQVDDINNAKFVINETKNGLVIINHDVEIEKLYGQIGGFEQINYLTEPLYLHHSDRDYYSPSHWNNRLSANINANGGNAKRFEYVGNTHSLKVSKYPWFSPKGTISGVEKMINRNIQLFTF